MTMNKALRARLPGTATAVSDIMESTESTDSTDSDTSSIHSIHSIETTHTNTVVPPTQAHPPRPSNTRIALVVAILMLSCFPKNLLLRSLLSSLRRLYKV